MPHLAYTLMRWLSNGMRSAVGFTCENADRCAKQEEAMLEAILAILCGLLLLSDLLGDRLQNAVGALKPFETVIGVVAIVVGVLNITSVMGVALVIAGLVLAVSAVAAIPEIGGHLASAGRWLSRFRVIIGLLILAMGIVHLLTGPGLFGGPNGPPPGVPPGGGPP
jgi:hypothetical protein